MVGTCSEDVLDLGIKISEILRSPSHAQPHLMMMMMSQAARLKMMSRRGRDRH
jgi:hypothetical protein